MNSKLIGSILLIVGTTIGAGMLALPLATAETGFFYSTLLLFACWFVMSAGAFLILEVNLWLPANSNMISMAQATLGRSGSIVAWVTYLLLLYSLLAAYIAGGGDFLKNLLAAGNITMPRWLASVIFAGLLGYVVCLGIRSVDIVNRTLMFVKLGAFFLIIIFIFPYVSTDKLVNTQYQSLNSSITVALTSFGFAAIVPSLRSYFKDDVKQLYVAILVGSLIPLVCYILWDIAIMGVIPANGEDGLIAMSHSGRSTSEFVNTLSGLLQQSTITALARVFTSICLATSFLGVALSLSHFLADGFRLSKTKSIKNDLIIFGSTFIPPLVVVLFYPGAFIAALSYAGMYCIVLLVLLPALMAWSGRYRKNLATGYRLIGGKPLLILLIIVSILIMGQGLIGMLHF